MRNVLQFLLFVFTTPMLVGDCAYAQWVKLNVTFVSDVRAFGVSDTNLFAGPDDEGIFLTTNKGESWTAIADNYGVNAFAVSANIEGGVTIFAASSDPFSGGVYRSTDNGASWIPVNEGLTDRHVHAVGLNINEDSSTKIFAGTANGVFISTNNGAIWDSINNGFIPSYASNAVSAFSVYGSVVYAATGAFGVFITTNNGSNWSAINNGLSNSIRTIATIRSGDDTILFAGTFTGGVFRSTNNGRNWEPTNTGLASKVIYCFAIVDDEKGKTSIFTGISAGAGVYLSTDLGVSWTGVDSGLATQFPPSVFSLAICGGYLFAGTDDGVWRRPLAEIITSVPRSNENIPNEFVLKQNYPNPFNPVTSIQYSVPRNQKVTLKVFDLLGREVATLVNEVKYAGSYRTTFNGVDLASGVYFYRLQAGSNIQTKKLMLQK